MNRTALFHRSELLVGRAAMERMQQTRVILFGIGGVGSWTAEALIRSGIGHLTIVDSDCVCITNANRQLQAIPANVGRVKVDELAVRLRGINPDSVIVARRELYDATTKDTFELESYDYVLDAIDSLSSKLGLIIQALERKVTLFSTMGASGKLDPTRVRIGSIWESTGCPLARRIRKRLRHHDITADFKAVYSDEVLLNQGPQAACGTGACFCPQFVDDGSGAQEEAHEWCSSKAFINGSMVHVTATFGMCLASLVVNDVIAAAGAMPIEKGIQMPAGLAVDSPSDDDDLDK
jgi:tRNA A37 threonylcarbamoyladenosine dehydratase